MMIGRHDRSGTPLGVCRDVTAVASIDQRNGGEDVKTDVVLATGGR
jgi:hypothetical protein